MVDDSYKYKELTGVVIGAAMEVHSTLKNGFQETIYQRALEIELLHKAVNFEREVNMPIYYKGVCIGTRRVDFLINSQLCVEFKATSALDELHMAQGLNYLEAFNLEVGLLINFGANSLEFKRLLNKKYNPAITYNYKIK